MRKREEMRRVWNIFLIFDLLRNYTKERKFLIFNVDNFSIKW